MYYEVILTNGQSLFFDDEDECDAWTEANDGWEAVYVRGEFLEMY